MCVPQSEEEHIYALFGFAEWLLRHVGVGTRGRGTSEQDRGEKAKQEVDRAFEQASHTYD